MTGAFTKFPGPVQVDEVDLGDAWPTLRQRTAPDGSRYGAAWVLLRIHGDPIGTVVVPFQDDTVAIQALRAVIDDEAAKSLADHLRSDGAKSSTKRADREVAGLPVLACEHERRRLLSHPPLASIVVPVVDRPEALRLCLGDLIAQEYPRDAFEIVVVDNSPRTSGAAPVVREMAHRGAHIRYVREAIAGSSRARNRGLRAAKHDIVAFVDGDVRVDRGWLASVAVAMSDEQVGCVTGMIQPLAFDTAAQRHLESWAGHAKGFHRQVFDRDGDATRGPLYPYAAAVFGSGANMSFRRNVLESLGGFDTALGAGRPARGGEDIAAFLDVILAGWRIVYEPAAIVWHRHAEDDGALGRKLFGYGMGLTAFLTRMGAHDPRHAVRIASRIPSGLRYLVASRSGQGPEGDVELPRRLIVQELAGMALGPLAYAAGLRHRRARWRGQRPAPLT